jgi:putative FmdB family regulatory protein
VPLYDYKCTVCENRYEVREGFDAPSRQPCPKCGSIAKRVLHPPPIVFKGSGFYVTDSRKGSQVTIGDNGGGTTGGGEPKTSESASSDSKPAPAAATSDD